MLNTLTIKLLWATIEKKKNLFDRDRSKYENGM